MAATSTDVLVIGAGVAGLSAAIAAAEHGASVIVCRRAAAGDSCTARAQGGVAAASSETDSFEAHIRDTLHAGAGLCDAHAVDFIVRRGRAVIERLLHWAMRFDTLPDGALALGLEAAHSHPRVLRAGGDETGAVLLDCLIRRASDMPNIRFAEDHAAIELLIGEAPEAPVIGARFRAPDVQSRTVLATSTVLATGGAAGLYRDTTNPLGALGGGIALAWRAGAEVADMAFIQFHPTVLDVPVQDGPRALISEAVRGEGARLVDETGRRFMPEYHEGAELAPRDVVSAAMAQELARPDAQLFLDARAITDFHTRFPGIAAALREHGLDPVRDLVPVRPAAHYTLGGVLTDLDARTTVPGLLAAGEVASTGLHGANRLASNSLLEGLVMGEAAGLTAARAAGAEVPVARRTAAGSPAARLTAMSTPRLTAEESTAATAQLPSTNGAPQPQPRATPWVVGHAMARSGGSQESPEGAAQCAVASRSSRRSRATDAGTLAALRSLMWRDAGLLRSEATLQRAAEQVEQWSQHARAARPAGASHTQLGDALLIANLIIRSALWRCESRGCHRRSDFPAPDPRFLVHDIWRQNLAAPRLEPVHDPARRATSDAEPIRSIA